jgi:two-component system chemotaxis sensor kinase CheA
MDEAALARELMSTYRAEARERLEAVTRLLLDLEKAPTGPAVAACVEQIFREVHSLKGAARSVSEPAVEESAHAFENLLALARGQEFIDEVAIHGWYGHLDHLGALIESANVPSEATPGATPTESDIVAAAPIALPLDESIRVAIPRLDRLLADAGSLLVSEQAQLEVVTQLSDICREVVALEAGFRRPGRGREPEGHIAGLRTLRQQLQGLLQTLRRQRVEGRRQLQTLSEDLRTLRMTPVKTLFRSFERMVHDLALDTGKRVEFEIVGEEVELDKAVLDALRDPIVHLLRNAVDHGVETTAERQAAGKPETGTLRLAASRRGSEVLITLKDDGRGIDPQVLRVQAVRSLLLTPSEAEALKDSQILDLIFRSGFSTRSQADEISGRGLGLAIVRQALEALHGRVLVESHAVGVGTTFEATVPLTLATTRCLLLVAGSDTYAVPLEAIQRTAVVSTEDIVVVQGRPAIRFEDRVAPFVHLATLLHGKAAATPPRLPAVILESAMGRVAIAGDMLRGERELVVKRFPSILPTPIPCLTGAAVLTSGEIVLVVDPADVVQRALSLAKSVFGFAPVVALAGPPLRPRVLVADDSLTTRTLERNILRAAGYDVAEVPDGAAAMTMLQAEAFDLVVSDVEMPKLDGIGLTQWIRAQPKLSTLPVVLVTAGAHADDRVRGLNAGADAYIVKRQFRQSELLEMVDRLLGRARLRDLEVSV